MRHRSRLLILMPLLAGALWLLVDLVHGAEQAIHAALRVDVPGLSESSALARSRRSAGVFWTLNDSGNPAELFAVDVQGRLRARLVLAGTRNQDWESLTAFDDAGRARLLVADVGDNFAQRDHTDLYLLDEPALPTAATDLPAAQAVEHITLRYPDGPRDCEAVFVDADAGLIYLLSKRDAQPQLYSIPLHAARAGVQTATAHGAITIPRAPTLTLWPYWINWVNGSAVSPDGRHLALVTPSRLHVYTRAAGEAWPDALRRAPQSLHLPVLPQIEAVAWAAEEDALFITSEGRPMPLVRIAAPPTSSR